MSEIYEIADAVAAKLTAAVTATTLTPAFSPRRVYLPIAELTALNDLSVLVMPSKDSLTVLSRGGMLEDISIDVGVLQHLPANVDASLSNANSSIDPLLKLSRAIAVLYKPGDSAASAAWVGTQYPLLFDTDRLKDDRVFQAVITFTFKQAQ
jgi:hypothetical protein